jgi:hypothetical protein
VKSPWRESDAPIVIGPVSAGALAPALVLLLLPPPLHAARTPTDNATAPMAMAFLEDQGRLHLIGSLTFEGGIPADSEANRVPSRRKA